MTETTTSSAANRRSRTPIERAALWLSRVGLFVIVLVTFITSFDAVSDVAVARGAVAAHLSWAIPLAIDGLIVVGSAIAWYEAESHGKWHLFPLLLVASAGALSVVTNIAHASGSDVLAKTLAGVPPAALLAAVELGAWQIRRDVRGVAKAAAHVVDTVAAVAATGDGVGDTGTTEATPDETTVAVAHAIRTQVDAGADFEAVSKTAVADDVGVHRSTVYKRWDEAVALYRSWDAAVDAVGVSSNGHAA